MNSTDLTLMDDRLSDLPDSIIHLIFAFLNPNEIPQLSILSRKFQKLCSSSPYLSFNLNFDAENCTPKCNQFQLHLKRFFDSHNIGGISISKLRLHWFCCSSKWQGKGTIFSMWFHKALRSNLIQELDIGVPVPEGKSFTLPNDIANCKSLKVLKLKLQGGATNLTDLVLENLEVLSLNSVSVKGWEFVDWINYCCKFLKVLNLEKVSGIENLHIKNSSLQVLTIVSCSPRVNQDPRSWPFGPIANSYIQIQCSSLEQFTISDCFYGDLLLNVNTPSLRELKVAKSRIRGFFDVVFTADQLKSLCLDIFFNFSCSKLSSCQIVSENCLSSLRDVKLNLLNANVNYREFLEYGFTMLVDCIRLAKVIKLNIDLISDLFREDQLPISSFESLEHLVIEFGSLECDEIRHVAAFLVGLRDLKSFTLICHKNCTNLSENELIDLLCSEVDELWSSWEEREICCLRSHDLKKVKVEFQWTRMEQVEVLE